MMQLQCCSLANGEGMEMLHTLTIKVEENIQALGHGAGLVLIDLCYSFTQVCHLKMHITLLCHGTPTQDYIECKAHCRSLSLKEGYL